MSTIMSIYAIYNTSEYCKVHTNVEFSIFQKELILKLFFINGILNNFCSNLMGKTHPKYVLNKTELEVSKIVKYTLNSIRLTPTIKGNISMCYPQTY